MAKHKKWNWKDEYVNYGKEPSSSELHVGSLRLVVHRYHGLNPKQWFLTCYELRWERLPLLKSGATLDEAKAHAIVCITEHIDELHELLHAHD